MSEDIIEVIVKMNEYKKMGGMNCWQIEEVVDELVHIYKTEVNSRLNRLMDDFTDYYTSSLSNEMRFRKFVKENMESVAKLLDRSKRTIYRKLYNESFTLIEKRKIERLMNEKNTDE